MLMMLAGLRFAAEHAAGCRPSCSQVRSCEGAAASGVLYVRSERVAEMVVMLAGPWPIGNT